MTTLPSSRELLISIVQQLAAAVPRAEEDASTLPGTVGGGGTILASLEEKHRQLLLTLHCLLPFTLLPALDLLDRGLVVQYQVRQDSREGGTSATVERQQYEQRPSSSSQQTQHVYYVSSVSTVGKGTSKYAFSHNLSNAGMNVTASRYEVRVHAWNCTCAGFIYSAMHPSQSTDGLGAADDDFANPEADGGETEGRLLWGGCTFGDRAATPPVCKHLVACILAECCGDIFGRFVSTKEVTREVLAEMAAIWE